MNHHHLQQHENRLSKEKHFFLGNSDSILLFLEGEQQSRAIISLIIELLISAH